MYCYFTFPYRIESGEDLTILNEFFLLPVNWGLHNLFKKGGKFNSEINTDSSAPIYLVYTNAMINTLTSDAELLVGLRSPPVHLTESMYTINRSRKAREISKEGGRETCDERFSS